jgi:hypothetical protein
MSISRYKQSEIFKNKDDDYRKLYKERFKGRRVLPQTTAAKLNYPQFEDVLEFTYANHIWSIGDRYYKLANFYYGDPEYWWLVAWFNKKPTEQHIKLGDVIRVPLPLIAVLNSVGL